MKTFSHIFGTTFSLLLTVPLAGAIELRTMKSANVAATNVNNSRLD